MLHRYRAAALLALAIVLAGCSGNYKFSDDQYRPLGDPQAEKRGHLPQGVGSPWNWYSMWSAHSSSCQVY